MSIPTQGLRCFVLTLVAVLTLSGPLHAQDTMRAAPDSTEQDSTHVLISAIESISGEIPENELFALNWRVNYSPLFFTMANVDIALSNAQQTARASQDSVTSPRIELTEAGISVNLDVSALLNAGHRDSYKRTIFVGPITKIFNTEAYYGVVGGAWSCTSLPCSRRTFSVGTSGGFFR